MESETRRMDWKKLLDATRPDWNSKEADLRSPFQRDVDRLTFSDAFRRLARKTQVHPLNENDHIHSRLTHSLEVATVGKSLGELIGHHLKKHALLPAPISPTNIGEIVQAACLAHDIGNPPFGHSGEEAIKEWFKSHRDIAQVLAPEARSDFLKFDGNAMSVRTLLSTGFYRQGMNPTMAVAGTLLKYPWPSWYNAGKDKFSYFQSEANVVRSIADTLGLIDFGDRFARHPLTFLMEAADDICYRIIDIEDATELGILNRDFMLEQFADTLELNSSEERYARYKGYHFRQRNSIIRAKLIGQATDDAVQVFIDRYDAIMEGALKPLDSLMGLSNGICKSLYGVYKGIENDLFNSRRKAVLELGAQTAIGLILDQIMVAVDTTETPPRISLNPKVRHLVGKENIDEIPKDSGYAYGVIMALVDYISGMTDHYATELCRKFLGLGY
ncbi:dGTP triphosphohydrolase [Pseudodesulfovibrio indicus]|uniref:dGTP triphosphohydrolase n=1 Tax=Pseudodesulfovibrio indicus TaxID=1716143 RepID=UPI00292F8B6D|nr:dNTP triphosphohydrolase [Pseudodesulfovibrio indicus]